MALGVLAGTARADVVPVAPLDSVLTRFVHGDRVDYGALLRDPGPLRRFLAACASARPERFTRAERLAFWINAYNARVLDGVIRRPRIVSVLAKPAQSGSATAGFFDEKVVTAGRPLSLDSIERTILRREFGDPRVHFVLNCASRSCPALPARALTAATLEPVLTEATRRFLADPSRNRLGPDGIPEVSKIFQWYASDFRAAGGVAAFLSRYWPDRESIAPDTRWRVLEYDWALNGDW